MIGKPFLVISRPGFADELAAELKARWRLDAEVPDKYSVLLPESSKLPALVDTVFARQVLPRVLSLSGMTPAEASSAIAAHLEKLSKRANRQSGRWTLHVFAADDNEAGKFAAKLAKPILKAVTSRIGAFAKRYVDPETISAEPQQSDVIVQVFVTSSLVIWVSVASLAAGISPHPGGNLRMRDVKGAPSRSARKLEEAFVVMGRSPVAGETAVDLGAAPGGWSLCLAKRGAAVIAVDHAELDLKGAGKLTGSITHLRDNGLKYLPEKKVTWLCCDMVLPASETLRVLKKWLQADLMTAFVVNVKLPRQRSWAQVESALQLLQPFEASWALLKARHLYHDRHEITLMGIKRIPQG